MVNLCVRTNFEEKCRGAMRHQLSNHNLRSASVIENLTDYDRVQPINVSEVEIKKALEDADIPALLCALAMLTGDEALLSEDLRPPTPPMSSTISPQGGMSAEAQRKARTLALKKIIAYRDAGCPEPRVASTEDLDQIMKFLIKDSNEDYLPILRHELGIPKDTGAPDWHKSDLAPHTEFRVAVIGAGVSGIAAAHRLQQAGVEFVIYEKNKEVGGVWWENAYPGCRLDTPNFAYSLSFAQKQDWPQQFSRQPEIQKYLSGVADATHIRSFIQFETEVVSMVYDDATARWSVTTRNASGEVTVQTFNAIITAVGQLNRPSFPTIEGRESFKGQSVHSAIWPQDLDLKGKRVAVVGTGASAYQIVPSIVDEVAELKVFQRNPPWMLPTPTYHHDIKPGMTWLLQHVPYYGRWFRFWQFWIASEGRLPLVEVESDWVHPVSVGRANETLRQECVAHLNTQFGDRPDLLAKVVPNYAPGGKRMLRDNGVWAKTLKQSHVSLITDPIDHMSETGIQTSDAQLHEVDVIVYATGFKTSDYLYPMKVMGRHGKDLHAWWQGDCRAYIGITIPGFPNLFMTGGPNTGVVVNGSAIFSAECAVEYAMRAIGHLLKNQHAAMDCKEEPFLKYNEVIDAGNLTKAWGVVKTTSWYKNSAGRASQTWPFNLLAYWSLTANLNVEDYEYL
jgi:4-hydroxyacetophenone monooxygenase